MNTPIKHQEPEGARQAHIYLLRLKPAVRRKPGDVSRRGRELLAHALFETAGITENPPVTGEGRWKKPFLVHFPDIHFNISHSGEFIACAVAPCEIGIDIQEMREVDTKKLGRHIFSGEEYGRFLSEGASREAFFDAWTQKEAYIKWTGEGLSRDLRSLPHDAVMTRIGVPEGYKCHLASGEALETVIHYEEETT